jgi:hypothetical protein
MDCLASEAKNNNFVSFVVMSVMLNNKVINFIKK